MVTCAGTELECEREGEGEGGEDGLTLLKFMLPFITSLALQFRSFTSLAGQPVHAQPYSEPSATHCFLAGAAGVRDPEDEASESLAGGGAGCSPGLRAAPHDLVAGLLRQRWRRGATAQAWTRARSSSGPLER